MIRAILFMIKIGLFIAASLWIVEHPGNVSLEWLDYRVTVHIGFLLVFLFIVFLYIVYGIFRLNLRMRAKQGHRALTLGLTAVAAGDAKRAGSQAKKARKLLPQDKGLTLLLNAQSARMAGNEEEAEENFAALMKNKDAAFLGVRGLLQASIDQNDPDKARALAYDALKLHPKQPWILTIVYDLEIQMRRWVPAQQILRRLEKIKVVDGGKAKSDRVAMLLAQADEALESELRDEAFSFLKQAYKLDPYFAPSVLRLSKMHIQRGARAKAASVIEKIWRKNPHPSLAYVWELAEPKNKKNDLLKRLAWFERLLSFNDQSVESYIAISNFALENGLLEDARRYLVLAQEHSLTRRVYHLLGVLEQRDGGCEEAIAKWLDKEQSAPFDKLWVCRETGRIYPAWSAIALPHGSFNTITWDFPQEGSAVAFLSDAGAADALLEAPLALKA